MTQEISSSGESLPAYQLWYGGAWHDAASGEWFDTRNPFTRSVWARVARAGAVDVDRAVNAARMAFETGPWPALTATMRGRLLQRLGELVLENVDVLAQAELRDNGKSITEMRNNIRTMADWYLYYGGLADKIEGQVIPVNRAQLLNYTVHEPLGVIAAVLPWNSPLRLAAWKLAPALAAGNTVLVKPSEHTSTSILEFARLIEQAGFPPGVVNVITGFGPEIVPAMIEHPHTAKVTFTGGEDAGRVVNEIAARNLKPALLELGGKSPQIVFSDADIPRAARGIAAGIFASSGQTCLAGSRLLAQHSVREALVTELTRITGALRLGDPMDEATHVGPVATPEQLTKILSYIDSARQDGALICTGGRAETIGAAAFVLPTILTGVKPEMRIAREEVFGPVLVVVDFTDEAEALTMANDSAYGLAAGVWTQDLARAHRVAAAVKAGTVWINGYRYTMPQSPFGGYKRSGIGRESGSEAMKEYLQVKSIWVDLAPEVVPPFR